MLAVVSVVVKWDGGRDGIKPHAVAIPSAARSQREAGIAAAAAAAPERGLGELPSRGLPAVTGNPFWGPSPERIARQDPPRDASRPPAPPQAPPLPFTYRGRIRSGGTTTVFLARQNRESIARVGDVLDDTYRVERIDEGRMVLVYLPLGTQQTLSFAAGSDALRSPPPGETAGAMDAASLQLDAPEEVSTGQDFVVSLSLRAGRKASVGVIYDPKVLSAIRRPAAGDATVADHGRVLVDVVGPGSAGAAAAPTAVRFRVVGGAPTTTQIEVEDLSATDDPDPESLNIPAPRRIAIGSVHGTR